MKRNKTVILVIVVLIAVGLLAGSGYSVWKYFSGQKDVDESSSFTTPVITTDIVQEALKSEYSPEDISLHSESTAPYWQVDDSQIYVNYTGRDASELDIIFDDTATVSDSDITLQRSDIISTVTASLVDQGLEKASGGAYGKMSDVFIGHDIICTIDSIRNVLLTSPVTLMCGSLFEYTAELPSYQSAREFASAYTAAGNTIKKGDTFTVGSNTASATTGYLKATVEYRNVGEDGGSSLLFYKKSDSGWQYFTGTQGEIVCTQYNTADLKAAFKGDACYNELTRGESTVK